MGSKKRNRQVKTTNEITYYLAFCRVNRTKNKRQQNEILTDLALQGRQIQKEDRQIGSKKEKDKYE